MVGPFLLAVGSILVLLAGAAMGWYPSRLNGPAFWLDDHFYRLPIEWMSHGPWWPASAAGVFFLGLGLSFTGYVVAAKWAAGRRHGTPRDLAVIVTVQALLASWMVIQPYISSQDIFSYAFYSHILVEYHANPYVAVPRDFPFDPLFSAIFWKDQPSNYGPLWTYLSGLAPLVVGTSVSATLYFLKGIAVVAALAATGILWSTLGRTDPERRVLGVVLWAWNPLILVEAAEAGHNDVVMALFLVTSLWFLSRDRHADAILALVLAALTKYVAILLVPLYLILWVRERHRLTLSMLARAGLPAAVVTLVAFAPVSSGSPILGILGFGVDSMAYSNSPLELAYRQIRIGLGDPVDLANLPLHSQGYWVDAQTSSILWRGPNTATETGIALPRGEQLLVVELPAGEWVHVYDPRVGKFGYVQSRSVRQISAPKPSPPFGPTVAVLEGSRDDPAAQRSNLVLRLVSFLGLIAAVLFAMSRVRDRVTLFQFSLLLFFVFLVGVQSWFWPWYLIWLVPFAAVIPASPISRAALALTATASILNAQPSITPPPTLEWLYQARMVAIDGVPIALAVVLRLHGWSRLAGSMSTRLQLIRVALRSSKPQRAALFLAVVALGLTLAAGSGKAVATPQDATTGPSVIAWQRSLSEAERSFSAGDDNAAAESLDRVLAERPNEQAAIRLRVAVNLDRRRFAEAIPDLTRLLDREPANIDYRLERATLYAEIQRPDRALSDFRAVMALSPTDPAAFAGAGLVEHERGNEDAALISLGQAIALSPSDAVVVREYADALVMVGRYVDARQAYNQAIALDPSDAQAYAGRAALSRLDGFADATVPDLQRVLVLTGDVQEHRWAVRLLSNLVGVPPRSFEAVP